MQQTLDKPGLVERSRSSRVLRHVVALCWGALLAGFRIGGLPLPVCLSAAAALPISLLPAGTAGVLIGLLLAGGMQSIRYAAACAVLSGVRLLFRDADSVSGFFWYEPLLAATVTLSTGVAMLFAGDGNLMFAPEALLAGLCAALFKVALSGAARWADSDTLTSWERRAMCAAICTTGYAATAVAFGETLQGAAMALLLWPALSAALPVKPEPSESGWKPPQLPSAQAKIERAAAALRELTERLPAPQATDSPSALFSVTIETLCAACPSSSTCWDTSYNTMMDALEHMGGQIARRGRLRESELPPAFTERCGKTGSFVDSVNATAERSAAVKRFTLSPVADSDFFKQQVKSFSLVLDDLGQELAAPGQGDAALTEMLEDYFKTKGEKQVSVMAAYGKHGKLRVSGSAELRPELSEMVQLVQRSCDCRMGQPELWHSGSGWHFVLSECETLAVQVDRFVSPAKGERVAGDAVRDFRTADMKYIVAVSDGMGAGRAAGAKSHMAVDYLEKLMQAGLRRESATQVLNAALLVGDPEVFATLDVAVLDLYSGDLELVKAGAAPSFVLREGEVTKIDSRSMPAGLLPVLEPEIFRSKLQPGDLLVMLSDGLLPPGLDEQPLVEFLKGFDRARGSLARALVQFCKKQLAELAVDDMTAVVLSVRKA